MRIIVLKDRVLLRLLPWPEEGTILSPESAQSADVKCGVVESVGKDVTWVKKGQIVAYTGRWNDLSDIQLLALGLKDYALIRQGDIMGTLEFDQA